jgi:hypothetical protein
MDAKTRYRQRRKLQAALRRVLEVLIRNMNAGIPADKATAKLAAQLMGWLNGYTAEVRVPLPMQGEEPDISRFDYLIQAKRKETIARYARMRKRARRQGPPGSASDR